MASPILLQNGWLAGSPVPSSCSPGNSPDFLDTTVGQLYTCVDGAYVQASNAPPNATQSYISRFSYKADANSQGVSDPGKGKLRWNNAVQTSATSIIVDRLTTDGLDVTLQILLLGPASRFIIQASDLAFNYQVWEVTSPGVVLADFFQVPCTLITGQGNPIFSNNQALLVLR